jgi:hypothetical protein
VDLLSNDEAKSPSLRPISAKLFFGSGPDADADAAAAFVDEDEPATAADDAVADRSVTLLIPDVDDSDDGDDKVGDRSQFNRRK